MIAPVLGRSGGRRSRLTTLATVLLVVVPVFLVALEWALRQRGVSIFDEGVHYDYVYRLLHGGLPQTASRISEHSVWESSCRGGAGWGAAPHCEHVPLERLAVGGVNYILPYFPLYYGIVAPFAAVLHALGMNLWDASRVMSAVLYAGGAGLLTWSLVRLGLSRVAALGVGLGVGLLPGPLYQGSTVTPDSMALLCGSVPLFLLSLRQTWGRRLVWGCVLAILIGLVKPNYLPLAGATVLLTIVGPLAEDDQPRARFWGFSRAEVVRSLAALVAPAVVAGAWQVYRGRNLAPGQTDPDGGLTRTMLHWDGTLGGAVADAFPAVFEPLRASPPSYPGTTTMAALLMVANAVIIAGSVVIALSQRRGRIGFDGSLALAAVGAGLLAAVYLPTTFYLAYHATGTQARYVYGLLPLGVGAVALFVSGKVTRWLILAAGGGFAVYSLLGLQGTL